MNRTRAQIRTKVRTLLNDPNGDRWDNTVINEFLSTNVEDYRESYYGMNPTDFVKKTGATVTYAALEDYHDITSTETDNFWIEKILNARDTTDSNASRDLIRATTIGEIRRIRDAEPGGTSHPSHYLYWNEQASGATGVFTRKMFLSLAPLPQAQRTILVEFQGVMSNANDEFDTDASTTALPNHAEACVVLKTAIDCRLLEENPNTRLLEKQFKAAELKFTIQSRKTDGRDDDMDFDESLLH